MSGQVREPVVGCTHQPRRLRPPNHRSRHSLEHLMATAGSFRGASVSLAVVDAGLCFRLM